MKSFSKFFIFSLVTFYFWFTFSDIGIIMMIRPYPFCAHGHRPTDGCRIAILMEIAEGDLASRAERIAEKCHTHKSTCPVRPLTHLGSAFQRSFLCAFSHAFGRFLRLRFSAAGPQPNMFHTCSVYASCSLRPAHATTCTNTHTENHLEIFRP